MSAQYPTSPILSFFYFHSIHSSICVPHIAPVFGSCFFHVLCVFHNEVLSTGADSQKDLTASLWLEDVICRDERPHPTWGTTWT